MKRRYFLIVALLCLSAGYTMTLSAEPSKKSHQTQDTLTEKLSIDGPYIFHQPDGLRVITVDAGKNIIDSTYKVAAEGFTFRVTDHEGNNPFDVTLRNPTRPAWKHKMPKKMYVMSDPHGRLDCFISALKGAGIIDDNLEWAFGKGYLMILGDVVDRGEDAIQIYWLIYKLEQEAERAGGHLSYILGNHDPMVLMNDLCYTKDKYKALAKKLDKEYPQLLSLDTELGRWLCSRNTIEMVGDLLFVHAGLSPALLKRQLSIPFINEQMQFGLYKKKKDRRKVSELVEFLYSNDGPVWYRGLVYDDEKYHPATEAELDAILKYYNASRIFVGHTIFDDISTFYNGKVIAVNVDNPKNMQAGRGRGVFIKGKKASVAGDNGIQRHLLRL